MVKDLYSKPAHELWEGVQYDNNRVIKFVLAFLFHFLKSLAKITRMCEERTTRVHTQCHSNPFNVASVWVCLCATTWFVHTTTHVAIQAFKGTSPDFSILARVLCICFPMYIHTYMYGGNCTIIRHMYSCLQFTCTVVTNMKFKSSGGFTMCTARHCTCTACFYKPSILYIVFWMLCTAATPYIHVPVITLMCVCVASTLPPHSMCVHCTTIDILNWPLASSWWLQ